MMCRRPKAVFEWLCQVDAEAAVECRDEEEKIPLSRLPLSRRRHQLRGSLVFPVQPEPARHRGVVA